LDQGHHFGRVAFADDLEFGELGGNFLQVGAGQCDVECAHVVFQIADAFGAGDRNHVFALRENPGKRELSRSNSLFGGEFFHRGGEFEIGLQGVSLESRLVGTAPVGDVKVLWLLDSAREEATA